MELLRPLLEAWLLKATEAPLPAWRRSVLEWALRRDERLRCLALELAEFQAGDLPADEAAPDLRPRLRQRVLQDAQPEPERPLFPSPWIPAGALALLLVIALSALFVRPVSTSHDELSSAPVAMADLVATPSATASPTPNPAAPTAEPTVFAAQTPLPH